MQKSQHSQHTFPTYTFPTVGTSANQLVQLDSNAKVPTFPAYIPNIVAQNYKYI